MKSKQRVVAIVIITLAILTFFLPSARDQFDWSIAQTEDSAAGYFNYMTAWPAGFHIVQARKHYAERVWADTKRAMIADAIKNKKTEKPDPDAAEKRKARREQFFWQAVTNENTSASYEGYLSDYPNGRFASEAHRRLDDLSRTAATNSAAQ